MSRQEPSNKNEEQNTANETKHGEFFCEQCNLDYFTRSQYEEHDWSLLHHQKLEKQQGRDFVHICSLCHFSCKGLSAYSKHLISDQHRQMLDQRREQNRPDRPSTDFPVFNKEAPMLGRGPNVSRYSHNFPAPKQTGWDYDMHGNRSFTDSDMSNVPFYQSFSNFNTPANVYEQNRPYQDRYRDGNYNHFRPQSAPGFYRDSYRQDRVNAHQSSFRSSSDYKKDHNSPYKKPLLDERSNSRNAEHPRREEGWRTSSSWDHRRKYQLDERAGSTHWRHSRSASQGAQKSSAEDRQQSTSDRHFQRPPKQIFSMSKSSHHRQSCSLDAVPVTGLASSNYREKESTSHNHDSRKEVRSHISSGNNNISGRKNVQSKDDSAVETRLGNKSVVETSKEQNSDLNKSKSESSSALQRLREAKAKKEELRKNQTNISELKNRIARGNAARSQKHLEDMDRSLKTVYSQELGKIQRPERQASAEHYRPPQSPSKVNPTDSISTLAFDTESPNRHHSRRAEFEMKYGDFDIGASTAGSSAVRQDSRSDQSAQRGHAEPVLEKDPDRISHSRDLHFREFENAYIMEVETSVSDRLQEGAHHEMTKNNSHAGVAVPSQKPQRPSTVKSKSTKYCRSDSFPPYPQGSITEDRHQADTTVGSHDNGSATNDTVLQYQRSKSNEHPSSDSSKEDQHAEGVDLNKLNLPASLQRELSKHIASKNIARSEGIAQPNLGQARSRLHVGQRPQSGDSQDIGPTQRLMQLMSSQQSKHRQEKQFEKLKQYLQAKKQPSRLPRFGLQLLPSHMTLPQLMSGTDSQDDADSQNESTLQMSDLDCRSPSPSSSLATKRSHSEMQDAVNTEVTVLEKDVEPKRRKTKTERISPPTVAGNESGLNIDVDTLYQISLKEEELLNNVAALNASVAEMKDFIQKKTEELKKIEAERDKATEQMDSLRRERMNILKGAVSERRGLASATVSAVSERQNQDNSNDTPPDTRTAGANHGQLQQPVTIKTEAEDARQPLQPVAIKTEPVDTEYEAAIRTPEASSQCPTPPLLTENPSSIIEQLVRNPNQFSVEEVESPRMAAVPQTRESSVSRTFPNEQMDAESLVSSEGKTGTEKEECSTVQKIDSPDRPTNAQKTRPRETSETEMTPQMSEDEVPPHLRSLEALQSSASFNVNSINASSSTLRQLAHNFLELKNASMLFLKEESKSAALESQGEQPIAEQMAENSTAPDRYSIQDMEICTTDSDANAQVNAQAPCRQTDETRQHARMAHDVGKTTAKPTQSANEPNREQHIYDSPFKAVVEKIMEESNGMEFPWQHRESSSPHTSAAAPQDDQSPVWAAPLSKNLKVTIRDIYKNPFRWKTGSECRKEEQQQETSEKTDSVHMNVRDYRSCGVSQLTTVSTSQNEPRGSELNTSQVSQESEVNSTAQSLTKHKKSTPKSCRKSKKSIDGKKLKKKKKSKQAKEDCDSESDTSPTQAGKKKVKRKHKVKAKSKKLVVVEDSSAMLAPPLPTGKRGRRPKTVNPDEFILPLNSDDDPQLSSAYSLLGSQFLSSEEAEDDTQGGDVQVPQSSDQFSDSHAEMPSSILGEGSSFEFHSVMVKTEDMHGEDLAAIPPIESSDEVSDSHTDMPSSILHEGNSVDFLSSTVKTEDTSQVLEVLSYDEEPAMAKDVPGDLNDSKDLPISNDAVSSTNDIGLDDTAQSAGSPTEEETTPRSTSLLLAKLSPEKLQVSPSIRNKLRLQVLNQRGLVTKEDSSTADNSISPESAVHQEPVDSDPVLSVETAATEAETESSLDQSKRTTRLQAKEAAKTAKMTVEETPSQSKSTDVTQPQGVQTGKKKRKPPVGLFKGFHLDEITSMQVNYPFLFTSSADGTIRKWCMETGEIVQMYNHYNKKRVDGVWCPIRQHRMISFTKFDHIIYFQKPKQSAKLKEPRRVKSKDKISCIHVDQRLFVGFTNGLLSYYESKRFSQSFNVCHPRAVTCIATAPPRRTKNNYVLVASSNCDITVHNAENLVKLITLLGHNSAVTCMKNGQRVGCFEGHESSVTDICFTKKKNGQLVTSSLDKFIRVFRTQDQTCIRKFGGFPSIVKCIGTQKIMSQNMLYAACQDGSLYGLPFDDRHVFTCQWLDCGISFMIHEHLVDHLQIDHIESDNDTNVFQCFWNNCKKLFAWKKQDTEILKEVHRHLESHVGKS
ncbi:zinc finger protein 106-like isoform X2 [Ptychodera flava]|uniref:zinc finger protein 106-like isoform X2 n=1 Tax=Ptychodera flava TaxID=63121 RepID=UPI00396A9980